MQEYFTTYHLPSLLKASWQAAVLILLVLAVQGVFGRRLSPRWRYGLWLLVVARLALPWTIPSPVSVFNLVSFPKASAAVASLRANPELPGSIAPPAPAVSAAAPRDMTAVTPAATAPGFSLNLSHVLLAWAAGAFALAGCLAITHFRLWRRVAQCRPLLDARVLNLLEDCKQTVGLRVPVTLVETPVVGSPALFGFVRPRLLLPAGLTRDFSQDELRYVFLHELSHIKRHDILTGWLMTALQILHWFNPLVWLAFHRMRVDRELACDALALSYAKAEENQPYGRTIIKLLEGFGCSTWAPSMAGTVEHRNQMKERISMIAKFRKTSHRPALAGVLFIALGLATLTDAQTSGKRSAQGSPDANWDLQQKLKMAEAGNKWAAYDLWDAYYRGHHGIQPDPAQADKWLGELVQDVWVVRFEPVADFAPTSPGEFLERIHQHSSSYSGRTNIGAASFFRTTKQSDKLVGSFLSNYPDQLKASLAKVPGLKVTSVEKITPEEFIKYEQSPQESLSPRAAGGQPPNIVATSPAVGATDVDPGLTEITVTFDQDMGDGMSWTGGGPEFPPALEGQKAQWRDKRTCVLPVKLEAGHYYRVGINSKSYQNFANEHGVAALPSAIFFTTQGASDELKAKTLVPQVVKLDPYNGAQNVSPSVTELQVTFNIPMGGGCSWCTLSDDGADFPKGREGKEMYWTEDKLTCVLPVELKPGMTYRIGLNAPEFKNFQSASGVPLEPVEYTFKTNAN